ncbi:MAG: hypothetical protein DLM67_15695 [Candidatus Nephthysia bennettiae]|uniref:Helix-turn-helix transcriptional regulator n=1 Tax=Candidatus Nephthysia bennettiae TaxID=3127016 RepID=A0A934K9J1_9BACT|nr:helix-turn-helix transcriptional regulator [Candidatus Dormibacteraeota bacterium]PZR91839.1 MAG: hypothetical protein DLM67_15695 [Candidatus Dormibacteraeota bacterium]
MADGRFASTRQNRTAGKALRAARLAAGPEEATPTQTEFAARLGDGLGLEISAAALSNWESGRRSVPSAVLLQAVAVSGGSADALLARARDRAAAGTSAGAAADEIDLAGLAEQVTEQGREIFALARTIARMRRRLEDEGILVAEAEEEGAGPRTDAM